MAKLVGIILGSQSDWEVMEHASKTLDKVTGAWVADQEVVVDDGKVKEYRVRLKVTFVLKD